MIWQCMRPTGQPPDRRRGPVGRPPTFEMQKWTNDVSQICNAAHSTRIIPHCLLLEQINSKADLRSGSADLKHLFGRHEEVGATRQATDNSANQMKAIKEWSNDSL